MEGGVRGKGGEEQWRSYNYTLYTNRILAVY